MALLQSYFDESYGPDGLVCVAGYVFTKSRAQALDKDWRRMLKDWSLPYFRMSSCAHGNYPFDKLKREERFEVEKEAIAAIHRNALHGIAVTVDPEIWDRVTQNHPVARFKGTPYEFCTWSCVVMVAMWAREKRQGRNSISYVFESGDAHQTEANGVMIHAFKHEHVREYCQYGGHAFVPKESARPTQAADLLAWQWFVDSKRRAKLPYAPRQDLLALIRGNVTHSTVHADEATLTRMIDDLARTREGKPMIGFPSSGQRS